MILRSISARYDEGKVFFDEDIVIPRHARLLVTILEDADPERHDFHILSATRFADASDSSEVGYSEADLRR